MVFTLLFAAELAQADSAVPLDRIDANSISLPGSSRTEIPDRVPITGPWRVVHSAGGVRTWEAPLPIRPRTLFFHRAPGNMAVFEGNRKLDYSGTFSNESGTWRFTSSSLQVRRAISDGAPDPGEYTMRYSASTRREKSLNFDTAREDNEPLTKQEFVQRSVQVGDTTRHGLFLPAPAEISFAVTVPEGAVFDLLPTIIPPEAADPAYASDGAVLDVSIDGASVQRLELSEGPAEPLRLDLSDHAGQSVTLTLATSPGPDSTLDYVFIADPIIHTPVKDPPRVVVLFLDTLRADHMGTYGYERPTTPKLDAWAEQSAVFTQARSIAPWTLPSARTMVTGVVPEKWGHEETIQERLAAAGWATTFIAGNIYLSSNFEMADDWGEHRCVNWPLASVQVDRALDYLDTHEDRPVLMVLHFMDMHLPYTEPLRYRYQFAGSAPEELPGYEFHLSHVKKAARRMGEEGKQYVRDRYDNNLRYLDDQVTRFLAHLDEDDTVILLADHGEEFWDHGGFEHGHTLYDELLRIPMIASGPGIAPGRFEAPVSMLDVAPTLARAAGLSSDGMTGWALQDYADRVAQFEERPQAFGRPLYGSTIWGSLEGGQKYITREGREEVYNVRTDPAEADDIVEQVGGQPGRDAMARALRTEVRLGYRLTALRSAKSRDVTARLVVPGGILGSWPAADPRKRNDSQLTPGEGDVTVVWKSGSRDMGEVFVVPVDPAEAVASRLELYIKRASTEEQIEQGENGAPSFPSRGPILSGRVAKNTVKVHYAVVPLPIEGEELTNAVSDENCAALQALGYVDECP